MTMAKRNRELALVERRRAKEAKKAARKLAAATGDADANAVPAEEAEDVQEPEEAQEGDDRTTDPERLDA